MDQPTPNETTQSSSTSNFMSNAYLMAAQMFFSSWKEERFKTLRPFGDFIRKDKMSVPKITEIPQRIKMNFVYFQTNYLLIFFILSLYSVLTSPQFLLSFGFIAFLWLYILKFRDQPLRINNQEIPEKIVTLFLLIVTALMIYISSAGSVI